MPEEMSDVRSLIRNHRRIVAGFAILLVLVVFGAWYAGTHVATVQYNSSGDDGGLIFSVASSTGDTYFVVSEDGKVGVNTLEPKTNLDVTGTIRAWWAFAPKCTPEIEGAMTYDRTTHHFVGCNGESWRILDN